MCVFTVVQKVFFWTWCHGNVMYLYFGITMVYFEVPFEYYRNGVRIVVFLFITILFGFVNALLCMTLIFLS